MASATLTDNLKHKTEKIEPVDFPIVEILETTRQVRLSDILPFRVRFTAIQIERLGLGNVPAIPLQVIGYSNYIL